MRVVSLGHDMTYHLVLGLVAVSLVTSACFQVEPQPRQVESPSGTPRLRQMNDWQLYQNSLFGLSFQFPPSMNLLLDDPDGSGLQLQDETLKLSISLNPQTSTTVEEYVSQLRDTGFTEKRRTRVSKGPWSGLRLEGNAKDNMLGISFVEIVYLIKSKDSLLAILALYYEPPVEKPAVDLVWDSLQLRFDSFALSPALLSSKSFTTFSSADGTFSFRYPTSWQATAISESLVEIVNPSDREGMLLSADRQQRKSFNLDDAVEQQILSIRAGFDNVITDSELPASVAGATDARRLSGSLVFNDAAPGKFHVLVAVTDRNIYVITVIFDVSIADSLLTVINEILQSLTLS